ncbi:hypothetical protein [Shewanella litorisediminis]|uniref:Lipoprotein n=1 Tax=Shewanella litorisediminis TaxID=1173586 RepID=A0ABX7G357_9GAMM|nr:hypothetical protein [Shewanella litorisediminis]MCL2917296.1 hypothetical protein [Shewanella litorisediminis]QRH01766.1 hypothetical protein JQC75_18290 [Shewanella litorisediminis]
MKHAFAALLVIFASGCATTRSEQVATVQAEQSEADIGHKNRSVMPGKAANPRKAVSAL